MACMSTITVIPGDGVGPEVIAEATQTLDSLDLGFDLRVLDHVNADTYLRDGTALSGEDVAAIRASAGTLLGAVGDPRLGVDYPRGVLPRLRRELDLYVNYRPVNLLHDRLSPLRDAARRPIDCVVISDNAESLATGGVSRVLDFAFAAARRSVCLVGASDTASNTDRIWQRSWEEIAECYPNVHTSYEDASAAAARLVAGPAAFDVIVANGCHGAVLTELATGLAGAVGLSAAANINGASGFGLFSAVPHAGPDVAGQGIANPIGATLSAALMIEHLGHTEAAIALRQAVATVIAHGWVTPDLAGELSTKDAGAAIRAQL